MELAVNIPEHEPHPGHAHSSISFISSSVTEGSAPFTIAVMRSAFSPRHLPASIGPPLQKTLSVHGEYNWVCHFFLSFSAFAYFFVGVLGVISVTGTLVLLTDNPSIWLTGKDNTVLKYADFFTTGAMVVGLFAVASFKSMNPVRWVRYASRFMVAFTIVLSFMTYPSRGINMLCIGMFMILFNYLRGRFSWRSLAVVTVLVCVFFVAVASLKGQYGNSDITDSKIAKEVALLPYKYVANNYWNLDYAFNRMSDIPEHEWTYGIDAFFGITHLMHIGDGIQQSFGWDSPYNESDKIYWAQYDSLPLGCVQGLWAPGRIPLAVFLRCDFYVLLS